MSECYICGAYILRGEGYRREVHTGTSTRVYATRRGGASFGIHSGPRTLCAICAEAQDRVGSGWGARLLLGLLGWLFSAFVGWQFLTSGSGAFAVIFGLLCILGVPVFVIGGILEHHRKLAIAEDIIAKTLPQNDGVALALRPGESIAQWLDRNPHITSAKERGFWETAAEILKPAIGQPIDEWREEMRAVYVALEEAHTPEAGSAPVDAGFNQEDSLSTWAERAASDISSRSGMDQDEIQSWLIGMIKYRKPRNGEDAEAYVSRVTAWFEHFDKSLDPTSSHSAIGDGETYSEWLARVMPLCLVVEDGKSIEDVIPRLAIFAETQSPGRNENAIAWLNRVQPQMVQSSPTDLS